MLPAYQFFFLSLSFLKDKTKKCMRCFCLSYAEIVCFIRQSDTDFVVSAVWAAFNDGLNVEHSYPKSSEMVQFISFELVVDVRCCC